MVGNRQPCRRLQWHAAHSFPRVVLLQFSFHMGYPRVIRNFLTSSFFVLYLMNTAQARTSQQIAQWPEGSTGPCEWVCASHTQGNE